MSNIRVFALSGLVFLSWSSGALAADRSNFYQRLEPRGNFVLHGAGQFGNDFFEYSKSLAPDTQPVVYMTYVSLTSDIPQWGAELKAALASSPQYLIPQVGLIMASGFTDGHEIATNHYEADVAAGKYDTQLQQFAQVFKDLHRPVFFRIGDEFNGFWMGFDPAQYRAAFQRITNVLRGNFLEDVATVWNVSVDTTDLDYMKWYPGDAYVDWWAINLFSADAIALPASDQFADDAKAHQKPVMIGEATPRFIGVHDANAWDDWFTPFFGFIGAHSNVKAFCYIDTNWGSQFLYSSWGDSRIQSEPALLTKYQAAIGDPIFLHQESEPHIRSILGLPIFE
jgi:hypothetical protein